MKRSLLEQETIILYNQAEKEADVYTCDPKLQKKLKALSQKYPDQILIRDALHYSVPKRCVLVREPYSEKRREAARKRAIAGHYQPARSKGE